MQRHSKETCGLPRKEIKENESSLEKDMKRITHTFRIMIGRSREGEKIDARWKQGGRVAQETKAPRRFPDLSGESG